MLKDLLQILFYAGVLIYFKKKNMLIKKAVILRVENCNLARDAFRKGDFR